MSVSTTDIKKKITATENMSKITKAMQMVSVAKLGKTETRVHHFRAYFEELKQILAGLMDLEYVKEHPFVAGHHKKKSSKVGCVLITSNRGLVGGYNTTLFKMLKDGGGYNQELFKIANDMVASEAHLKFYVTGSKGAIFARNELPEAATEQFILPDELEYTDILELASRLITDYLDGEIGEIIVVYQDFVSKLEHQATKYQLLPIVIEEVEEKTPQNFEIRPSIDVVSDGLLVQYVMTNLYDIFLRANQSEHAARMNSMSNATDNADDIIKESKLLYNRARQAAITQELNEIVAGANAVN